MEPSRLRTLFAALDAEGVAYVLVGGMAMNLHGLVRATEDADLFVSPEEANVERLQRALYAVTGDPEVGEIRAADLQGSYPVVRYVSPGEDLTVDVLARLGERFAFADVEATRVDFDGVPVRVATPATLLRMKRDTVRPIDREDAARLRATFPELEGE